MCANGKLKPNQGTYKNIFNITIATFSKRVYKFCYTTNICFNSITGKQVNIVIIIITKSILGGVASVCS